MAKKARKAEAAVDPVAATDRRDIMDRRHREVPVAVERRRGERRRQIDPTTCERDYDVDEIEFMKAMDEYKRDFGRPFPTWSEVLEVAKSLGYRKVAERTAIVATRGKASGGSSESFDEEEEEGDDA